MKYITYISVASTLLSVCLSSCHRVDDFPKIKVEVPIADTLLEKKNVPCVFLLTDKEGQEVLDEDAKIRLRGNSTALFPKRPFRIKLSEKTSLCGMPQAKQWILLANYFDKTMLRNALAFKLSEDSRLAWTPRYRFVELYYNDAHKGTYQLCEKVQVHANRVEVPQDGWLIEVDGRVDTTKDVFFNTKQMPVVFRIEWPKVQQDDPCVDSIRTVFLKAEEALFGADFADQAKGWQNYLDKESWVDWYLINEITKNFDANFNSSCYMHSGSDGKIVMGPVWDFDISMGNTNSLGDERLPQGWYIRRTNWYTRLFEDPEFVSAVKERFAYFYNQRENYYQYIRDHATQLRPHALKNDKIWHTIGVLIGPNPIAFRTYDKEVEVLIGWLKQRFEWINSHL